MYDRNYILTDVNLRSKLSSNTNGNGHPEYNISTFHIVAFQTNKYIKDLFCDKFIRVWNSTLLLENSNPELLSSFSCQHFSSDIIAEGHLRIDSYASNITILSYLFSCEGDICFSQGDFSHITKCSFHSKHLW